MSDDEDLFGIDLKTWRVPPPAPIDRPTLVRLALRPAVPARPRARLAWGVAALVVANAAIAAGVAIAIAPARAESPASIVMPAGDGSLEARVNELLGKLEQKQRALEGELAEIQQMRVLITELADKVRRLEERDRTVKPPDPLSPKRTEPPVGPSELEQNPFERPAEPAPVATDNRCDEVSCVLTNYEGACCTKYRHKPDALDRTAIIAGIASVSAKVTACATSSTAHGKVKVHVRVRGDGHIAELTIAESPDAALGDCVATAMRPAVFPRTQNGGSFTYPFVF